MKKKLLIIDDDENMLELLRMEFSDEGYQTIAAKDAFEALKLLKNEQIDLVMLDLKMPGMDGIEALERILAIDRQLPVVIHSAYSHYKDNYLTWTAAEYIVKSGNLAPLKSSVRKHLSDGGGLFDR